MTTFLTILLVLALIGVLGVLGMGIIGVVRGGGNPQRSNKLMQSRVALQAIALVLLAALMMLARH
jgi:NADH:ubiquinone oxidoreductase subunit 6 (subunit J)